MARKRAHRRAVLPMGDMFAVGGCDCTCPGASVTCKGCNGLLLTSYSIQQWTSSGGSLVATLTTNGSGVINVPTGTWWLIPASGRFAGQSVTVPSGGTTVSFSPATNYYCIAGCAIPVSATLHFTCPVIGTSIAITYIGSSTWNTVGLHTFSSTGLCGCTVQTVPYSFTFNGSTLGVNVGWDVVNNPPAPNTCPSPSGPAPGFVKTLSGVCFPLNLTVSFTTSATCTSGIYMNDDAALWGAGVGVTWTLTE